MGHDLTADFRVCTNTPARYERPATGIFSRPIPATVQHNPSRRITPSPDFGLFLLRSTMNIIPLSSIIISPNRQRREFDPVKLEELKSSIELSEARNTQLLHAPVLRREGDKFVLVAGETRLKAIADIFALGGSFIYSGRVFEAEDALVPYTDLGELSPLEAEEAELDENIRRKDLTWQEHAQAVEKLHKLRNAQRQEKVFQEVSKLEGPEKAAVAAAIPRQTVADTARELTGRSDGAFQDTIRKELIIAQHLDNPAIAGAKSAKEAFKLLKKQETQRESELLAVAMGKTAQEDTYEILNMDCITYMSDPANHGKFDVILTDAPYGMGAQDFGDGAGRLAGTTHEYDDSFESWKMLMRGTSLKGTGWCDLSYLVAKPKAHAYVFCDIDNFPLLKSWMTEAGWDVFRTPLIAYKLNSGRVPRPEHGPRRQYETILYAIKGDKTVNHIYPDVIPSQGDENMGHGAQKPVALFQNLLQRSVKPGDMVLDSFAGSGPLLEAAATSQVYSVLIEAVPTYYGLILKRAERLRAASTLALDL